MKDGIVIVRILFCSEVIGAWTWARKVVGMGNAEPDGPQFEV